MPIYRVMVTTTSYYDIMADSKKEAVNIDVDGLDEVDSSTEIEVICLGCDGYPENPGPLCDDCLGYLCPGNDRPSAEKP